MAKDILSRKECFAIEAKFGTSIEIGITSTTVARAVDSGRVLCSESAQYGRGAFLVRFYASVSDRTLTLTKPQKQRRLTQLKLAVSE